jgi:hypothetical protein
MTPNWQTARMTERVNRIIFDAMRRNYYYYSLLFKATKIEA